MLANCRFQGTGTSLFKTTCEEREVCNVIALISTQSLCLCCQKFLLGQKVLRSYLMNNICAIKLCQTHFVYMNNMYFRSRIPSFILKPFLFQIYFKTISLLCNNRHFDPFPSQSTKLLYKRYDTRCSNKSRVMNLLC